MLEYPTTGCGGAVIQTPLPGKQFVTPPANAQASAKRFYAKAAALHVHWFTSMQCTHTGHTHVLVPAPQSDGTANFQASYDISHNWSGYQIYNTAQYTEAGWTIPAAAKPQPGYTWTGGYYSSTWTGIGGGAGANLSDPLIQAGTQQDINPLDGSPPYYFWYEIVGGPTETKDSNGNPSEVMLQSGNCGDCLTANPGDSAGSVAIWTPTQPGSSLGVVQLGVCDFTAGGCVSFYIGGGQDPDNRPYTPQPGDSTEWIVEAPAGLGYSYLPLADFNQVPFTAAVWTDNYVGPGSQSFTINDGVLPTPIWLLQTIFGSNQYLAVPSSLGGDGASFTDHYQQPIRGGNN